MGELDPALERGLQPRSVFEYVAWVALGLGLHFSVATNPNFKWDVAAKCFTHESIRRALMLTVFLADRTEATSDDLRHVGGLIQGQADQCCHDGCPQSINPQSLLEKVL
ncbi:hypothetical protein [Nocardia anaemiae]|uniref:hypothetical protein n=1 Tax=Nocardia anaemiae TaxID=263910 RepID=UPI0007A3EB34|nr:hypothetical protein [Nocardia anaemiae]